MDRLRITEIFYSLQGEANTVGIPTTFIRFTGCPLRCNYCDTSYAFSGGEWLSFERIMQAVKQYQTDYVTVTGGEPLAQKACPALLQQLIEASYQVSLETSGALSIAAVDPRVVKVMDLKTPSSHECDRNLFSNIEYLQSHDQVKFVIGERADYDWAKQQIADWRLHDRCQVLFSPSYSQVEPSVLADWVLADQLPVRFQLQLHKVLWGDSPGR